MQRRHRMSTTYKNKRSKETRTHVTTDTKTANESASSINRKGLKTLREQQNKILDILSKEQYVDNRENSSLLVATMAETFKKKVNALEQKLSDVQHENTHLKHRLRRMKSYHKNNTKVDVDTSTCPDIASMDGTVNKGIMTHTDNIDASTQTSSPKYAHETDEESSHSDEDVEGDLKMNIDESSASTSDDLNLTTLNRDVLLSLLNLMRNNDEEAASKAYEALNLLGHTLGHMDTDMDTDACLGGYENQLKYDAKQNPLGDEHDELTEATDSISIVDMDSKDTCGGHEHDIHKQDDEQVNQGIVCYDEHRDDENQSVYDDEDSVDAAFFQTNHIVQRNYGLSSPVPLKRSHIHELEGILGIDPDESMEYNFTNSYFDPQREYIEGNGDCNGNGQSHSDEDVLFVEGDLVARGFEVLAQERDELIHELMALYDLEKIHQSRNVRDVKELED